MINIEAGLYKNILLKLLQLLKRQTCYRVLLMKCVHVQKKPTLFILRTSFARRLIFVGYFDKPVLTSTII